MLKLGQLKHSKTEDEFETKYNEMHSKSIKEVQNTPEYKQNLMQIDSIKKVLINNADVPEKLVSWLIESVESNTVLEYSVTNKKFFHYFKNISKR